MKDLAEYMARIKEETRIKTISEFTARMKSKIYNENLCVEGYKVDEVANEMRKMN